MTVEPGEYEHFKVFYRTRYDDRSLWGRPLAMFTELVERDGDVGPRFRRVIDEA